MSQTTCPTHPRWIEQNGDRRPCPECGTETCRHCGAVAREADVCDPCFEARSDAWWGYHYAGGPVPEGV